jgi:small subunit ribosomal protein S14
MAKLSAVNKNKKRIKLSDRLYKKRAALKKIVMDKKITLEERFKAQQKLAKLPKNSAKIRVMNRCEITGRPHGVYRKLKISRIALRQLGLQGKIPGLVKSSW